MEIGPKRVRNTEGENVRQSEGKKDSEIEMKRVRKSDRGGCGNWTNTGTEIGPKGYGHRTKKGTEIRRNRVRKAVQERCENRTIKGKEFGRKNIRMSDEKGYYATMGGVCIVLNPVRQSRGPLHK